MIPAAVHTAAPNPAVPLREALAPRHAEALHALGVAAYQAGRLAEAAELLRLSLLQDPGSAGTCNNLGLALAGLGRFEEALASYDRAIGLQPAAAEALSNRGNALRELGRPQEALASLDRALALRPGHVEAWTNRGLVLVALGRAVEAVASHDRALALRPDLAPLHLNRGTALRELGRLTEALASYDRAIALWPDYAEAHCNRGTTLRLLGRPAEALASLDRALALPGAPAEAEAARGAALTQLDRAGEALALFDRLLACRPTAAVHSHRGVALTLLSRPAEALASFDCAAALAPGLADPWLNRGAALGDLGRWTEALAALDHALALSPGEPVAEFDKALLLLQAGRWAEGWPLYEARWRMASRAGAARGFAQPQWRGEKLAGRTLLLHAEQGAGDTLQFGRFATLAAARAAAEGGRVVMEVPSALRALFATLPGGVPLVDQGTPLPPFDLHCPLPSLPLVLGTTLANLPAPAAYLHADAARCARWAPLLADLPRPRIGIAWAGNPQMRGNRARSSPLAALLPLLGLGGAWVSLQKDVPAHDRAALARVPGLRQFGPLFADFADTAAVMTQLDLVVTICTSVAHLAGALGRPTWVLLSRSPDWRWLLDRSDSPWYPTARLFRQTTPGDWDGVVGQVQAALARLPGGAAG